MQLDPTLLAAVGAGLVVGAIVVHLLHRRAASSDRERAEQLSQELEETREELESHREEVARHFVHTSDLFRDLTEQYSRLYAHLAEGARAFSDDGRATLEQVEPPRLEDRAAAPGAEPTEEAEPSEGAEPAEKAETAEKEQGSPPPPGPQRANGGSHPDAPPAA